jgi:hypothetical protein
VRRRTHESDLPADSQPLIDTLVEKPLLVRDREREGHVVVEVVLESLFDQWDALKGWLHEHTEDLKTVADIKRSAAGWRAHGQDPHWLLEGTRLANAENLAATPQFTIRIAGDSDFLATSGRAEDKTAATTRRRALTAVQVATPSSPSSPSSVLCWPWSGSTEPPVKRVTHWPPNSTPKPRRSFHVSLLPIVIFTRSRTP